MSAFRSGAGNIQAEPGTSGRARKYGSERKNQKNKTTTKTREYVKGTQDTSESSQWSKLELS
jgi:hypothetical protein